MGRPILPVLYLNMKSRIARTLAAGFLAATTLLMAGGHTLATELKLRSQLVWGTDGAKPDGKDLVELDGKLKDKLKALRWKNYWVIKSQESRVSEKEQNAQLGKCAVQLRTIGNGQLEVRLFSVDADGKQKLLRTVTESVERLDKGGALIIGGDSKDKWDDAWMVIITTIH